MEEQWPIAGTHTWVIQRLPLRQDSNLDQGAEKPYFNWKLWAQRALVITPILLAAGFGIDMIAEGWESSVVVGNWDGTEHLKKDVVHNASGGNGMKFGHLWGALLLVLAIVAVCAIAWHRKNNRRVADDQILKTNIQEPSRSEVHEEEEDDSSQAGFFLTDDNLNSLMPGTTTR